MLFYLLKIEIWQFVILWIVSIFIRKIVVCHKLITETALWHVTQTDIRAFSVKFLNQF